MATTPRATRDATTTERPDRLSDAAAATLRPDSLVGSFFLSAVDRGWQGCVVAEPVPGTYLVETFSWMSGHSTGQYLVPLTDMTGWQFYDTAAWMTNAYEHGGVHERWERERAERDAATDAGREATS